MTPEQRERVASLAEWLPEVAATLEGYTSECVAADAAALRSVLAEAEEAAKLREAMEEIIRILEAQGFTEANEAEALLEHPGSQPWTWLQSARALRQEGKG